MTFVKNPVRITIQQSKRQNNVRSNLSFISRVGFVRNPCCSRSFSIHFSNGAIMIEVKHIDRKVSALQEAQNAMLTLNKHLGREVFSADVLSMISELKVDLAEIRYENNSTFS